MENFCSCSDASLSEMEWKATIVILEVELVLKTKSLLTSAHLNVILVFHGESL